MSDKILILLQALLMLALAFNSVIETVLDIPPGFNYPPFVHCLSLTLTVVALAMVLLGGVKLGKFARIHPRPSKGSPLRKSGVYAFCRHPMYSGLILMGFAWAVFRQSYWALVCAVLLAVLLNFKARKEEKYMLALHGDEYKKYMNEVGRFV